MYNRSFGKHNIDALFLYNQQSYDNGDIQDFRKQGIAGRLSYTYDNRYIGEFNFGYNGSENFAKGQRFGFFPSVAVGWIMSEEPWMEKMRSTFDLIKFRASVGQAGDDNLPGRRFAYMTTLNTDASGYKWGTTGQRSYTGITEGQIGATNLTWETVTKYNLGIELGLFNMLNLNVDLFKEKRKDIFMQRRLVPTQTGFQNAPWANFGKVTNAGFEVTMNFKKQWSKDFFTSAYFNFTYAKTASTNMMRQKRERAPIAHRLGGRSTSFGDSRPKDSSARTTLMRTGAEVWHSSQSGSGWCQREARRHQIYRHER